MSDTTATARRVGRHTHLGPGWTELPTRPGPARKAAQRVLDACCPDPHTGLWPSGKGPSASWQRVIAEAAALGGGRPDDAEAAA
ncbi:hypothetical protein [Nocardiopsis sp. FR26]|uniref:hypothetical protein n=1 Tax=Nocardiopsis sp. FR26 TaxID=2605987 RepID=UPI00135920B1|nr:hypothetical protein [Nocardiopsis sp. FR26]